MEIRPLSIQWHCSDPLPRHYDPDLNIYQAMYLHSKKQFLNKYLLYIVTYCPALLGLPTV